MLNTTDKYIIVTFSIVNNPYTCYPNKFITKNYSSKFAIMSFWAPVLKSFTENGIPKNSLDTSLKSTERRFKVCSHLSTGVLEQSTVFLIVSF